MGTYPVFDLAKVRKSDPLSPAVAGFKELRVDKADLPNRTNRLNARIAK
jgi:hypothetical protein